MSEVSWGLDIGGTKCALVAGNESGEICWRTQVATASHPNWESLLEALLMDVPSQTPAAVGVSCGGPLDSRNGIILSPPNLPGWDDVLIVEWLRRRLNVPVFLHNDANACALAEFRYGAGRGCSNMIFITFGTGLGAGLILDGKLYTGANDMAGEIGHIRAAEDGPIGYGKAGSFEGFCSGGGIARMAGGGSAREVVRLAEAGDRDMRAILDKSAYYLGYCLAMLIDLFNPERIVIGGVYARAERHFWDAAMRVVQAEAHPRARKVCRVLPAALGDAVGDIAAITVAWNGLMEERTHA